MGRTPFWVGEKLRQLLTLSIDDLELLYPQFNRNHLIATKSYWSRKVERQPQQEENPFIRQARPTVIRPTRRRKPQREDTLTVLAGEAQIGYRGDEPFHDETAMELFQLAVQE